MSEKDGQIIVRVDLHTRVRAFHFISGAKTITKPLTLCIISRNSAKPVVAAAARSFLQTGMGVTAEQHFQLPQVTVDTLSMLLESMSFAVPDTELLTRCCSRECSHCTGFHDCPHNWPL